VAFAPVKYVAVAVSALALSIILTKLNNKYLNYALL